MYGHELSAKEEYFGPVPQGQTWQSYETKQAELARNLMIGSGVAVAAMVNPVVGAVALIGWLAAGGTGQHQNKPKTQGG